MASPFSSPTRLNSGLSRLVPTLLALSLPAAGVELTDADLCVYGGTSGGVVAAVTAARMGKTAVLIEPGHHLGGMTSSGLGVTDIGPHGREYIGGLSREFYRRVGAKYGEAERVWFEPKIAEIIFNELAAEPGVTVLFGEELASVLKTGAVVARLVTSSGRIIRARMFVDATYEGDLLAAAGVSWTAGREANSQYGETLNGVRTPTPIIAGRSIDPYVVPGNPASGLISWVRQGPAAAPGSADGLLQAFNYRLCLTNLPANRLAIDPPTNYNAADYEVIARYLESGPAPGKPAGRVEDWILDELIDVQQLLPNGKTDINAGSPVATDFHRGNDGYVTATRTERALIAARHEHHIRGILHFLRTDARVPANVRAEMATWGLCKDEFTDNGGWPRQLYVREARRMISDYVMTEKHGNGTAVAPDPIGLAAYWLDSHSYQLLAINGQVRHEGGFFTSSPLWPPAPFPISFRSIVPKKSECSNLAAPFCLSASHAAFASLRMEPVFMLTSQAAATAAALAIDGGTAIQDVPFEGLKTHLLGAGQVLSLIAPAQPDGSVVVDTENTSSVTIVGSWAASTSVPGYQGTHYLNDANAGQGTKAVTFRPNLPAAANYKVAVAYRAFSNRATNVPMTLIHAGGTTPFVINQQTDAGAWKELGKFAFAAGTADTLQITNTGTNGFVIADAVRWVPDPPPPPPPPEVSILATDPLAVEGAADPAKVTFFRPLKSTGPLGVSYTLSGGATPGFDVAALTGTATIPANANAVTLTIAGLSDGLIEGDETLVLTLTASATLTPMPGYESAALTLRDPPFDAWRAATFPPAQAMDAAISGPLADPDGDGSLNLVEWAMGLPPQASQPAPLALAATGLALDVTFTRRRDLPDGTLVLQTSEDAVSWLVPTPAPALVGVEEFSPTVDRLTYRLGAPASRLLLRLQAH